MEYFGLTNSALYFHTPDRKFTFGIAHTTFDDVMMFLTDVNNKKSSALNFRSSSNIVTLKYDNDVIEVSKLSRMHYIHAHDLSIYKFNVATKKSETINERVVM